MTYKTGLLILAGLLVGEGLFLDWQKGRFNQAELQQIIYERSRKGTTEDNPCSFQVTGDPTSPDKRRIRVDFWCADGMRTNTIAMAALADTRSKAVLEEIARIDWFDADKVYKAWKCTLNGQSLKGDEIIKSEDEIKCVKI